MGVWGSITRVESPVRPPLLLASAAVLCVGLGTWTLTQTDIVAKRAQAPTLICERDHVFWLDDQVYADWPSAETARRRGAHEQDGDVSALRGVGIREMIVDMGYLKTEEDGSMPFVACRGREELWVSVIGWGAEGRNPAAELSEAQQTNLRGIALAILSTNPALSGRKLGVSASAPTRTWANHRATLAAAGGALSWISGPMLACVGWAELAARARPRRIRAGLCPKCKYTLAGADVARCPECGQELSLHERSVLAAMIVPHRRRTVLPA